MCAALHIVCCTLLTCCSIEQVVGGDQCPIVDTYWQTETGAHVLAPLPGVWPAKPGSATLPFFGVQPAMVNEQVPVCPPIRDVHHVLAAFQ